MRADVEEPLIKKKINNPYLVDQHLLENKMPKITINGKEIEFEKGMTVLQACELAEVEIQILLSRKTINSRGRYV